MISKQELLKALNELGINVSPVGIKVRELTKNLSDYAPVDTSKIEYLKSERTSQYLQCRYSILTEGKTPEKAMEAFFAGKERAEKSLQELAATACAIIDHVSLDCHAVNDEQIWVDVTFWFAKDYIVIEENLIKNVLLGLTK